MVFSAQEEKKNKNKNYTHTKNPTQTKYLSFSKILLCCKTYFCPKSKWNNFPWKDLPFTHSTDREWRRVGRANRSVWSTQRLKISVCQIFCVSLVLSSGQSCILKKKDHVGQAGEFVIQEAQSLSPVQLGNKLTSDRLTLPVMLHWGITCQMSLLSFSLETGTPASSLRWVFAARRFVPLNEKTCWKSQVSGFWKVLRAQTSLR